MELEKARKFCRREMDRHGLTDYKFRFRSHPPYNAQCDMHPRIKQIRFCSDMTRVNTRTIVRNIILHEIAHALVGPRYGHGKRWEKKAIQIGCTKQSITYPKKPYYAHCLNCNSFASRWYKRVLKIHCDKCKRLIRLRTISKPEMLDMLKWAQRTAAKRKKDGLGRL